MEKQNKMIDGRIKEEIVYAMKKVYCGVEDAIMESDATKDDFIYMEDKLSRIAEIIGVSKFYPFK